MRNCKKIEQEMAVNFKGEIVYDKDQSNGLQTKYIITNPDLMGFVNETGNNTNQK
jgi:hypothetical protein